MFLLVVAYFGEHIPHLVKIPSLHRLSMIWIKVTGHMSLNVSHFTFVTFSCPENMEVHFTCFTTQPENVSRSLCRCQIVEVIFCL